MDKFCDWCDEPILEGERSTSIPLIKKGEVSSSYLFFHWECDARKIIGSLGHQRKQCSCYGGQMEDPPEMTKREAAITAFEEYLKFHH